MKNLILTLTVGILLSAFATSCTKCGVCNHPVIDIDIETAKVCKGGNKTEYNAAVAECEKRGSDWYWDVLEK